MGNQSLQGFEPGIDFKRINKTYSISTLIIQAPQVMRFVAPGLYPAIWGSTPQGRTILQISS